MPQGKIIILPPMKGFAQTSAYVAQPEGTSPEVVNVLLLDPATERFRPAQRPGVGVFDLFNFHTGQTENFPTITIPADGKDASDGDAVNVPVRGCYTVTTDSDLIDVTSTGNCDGSTIQIGGTPNPGGGYDGNITITPPPGGGDPIDIPYHHNGGSNFVPTENPDRPYMLVKTCGTDNSFAFWVRDSVLATFNALPALKDAEGNCYHVTGQRTATPNTTADVASFTVLPNCDACTGTTKYCTYPWTQTFNCDTGLWGTVSYLTTQCLPPDTVTPNTWVFDGDTSTAVRTYNYYAQGGTCNSSATCLSIPTAPTAQTATPSQCAGDPCDTACCPSYIFSWYYQVADGGILILDESNGLYYANGPGNPGPGLIATSGGVACDDLAVAHGTSYYAFTPYLGASGSLTAASTCPPETKAGWTAHGSITLVDAVCSASVTSCYDLPDVLAVVGLIENCEFDDVDDVTKPIWDGYIRKVGLCDYYARTTGDRMVRVKKKSGGYFAAVIRVYNPLAPSIYINGQGVFAGAPGQSIDCIYSIANATPTRRLPLTVSIHA